MENKKQHIVDQLKEMKMLVDKAWLTGYRLREDLGLLKERDNIFQKLTDQLNSITVTLTEVRDFHCEHNKIDTFEDGTKVCRYCSEEIE